MVRVRRLACIGLILLLANLAAANAQEAALSDEQVKGRLEFITEALRAGRPAAGAWWYGWMAAYSAGAIAGGAVAASGTDYELAEDVIVGGATCALGVVGLVIDPFVPATAPRKLRPLEESTPAERLAKLRRAEELLRACARREKGGRSLTTHLLNLGANATAGIVTAVAFKRPWTDGLITFAAGEAVSLLNIFTQPMRATRDLKKYEAGDVASATMQARWHRSWSLSVWPRGFSFCLQF